MSMRQPALLRILLEVKVSIREYTYAYIQHIISSVSADRKKFTFARPGQPMRIASGERGPAKRGRHAGIGRTGRNTVVRVRSRSRGKDDGHDDEDHDGDRKEEEEEEKEGEEENIGGRGRTGPDFRVKGDRMPQLAHDRTRKGALSRKREIARENQPTRRLRDREIGRRRRLERRGTRALRTALAIISRRIVSRAAVDERASERSSKRKKSVSAFSPLMRLSRGISYKRRKRSR